MNFRRLYLSKQFEMGKNFFFFASEGAEVVIFSCCFEKLLLLISNRRRFRQHQRWFFTARNVSNKEFHRVKIEKLQRVTIKNK